MRRLKFLLSPECQRLLTSSPTPRRKAASAPRLTGVRQSAKLAHYLFIHSKDHSRGGIEAVCGPGLPGVNLARSSFPCQDPLLAGPRDGLRGSWQLPAILRLRDEAAGGYSPEIISKDLGLGIVVLGTHGRQWPANGVPGRLVGAAILIMDKIGTPDEGTRPTSGRFCGGVGRVPSPGGG